MLTFVLICNTKQFLNFKILDCFISGFAMFDFTLPSPASKSRSMWIKSGEMLVWVWGLCSSPA